MKLPVAVISGLLLVSGSAAAQDGSGLVFDGVEAATLDAGSDPDSAVFRGIRLGQTPLDAITILHREFPTSGLWWFDHSLEVWISAMKMIALIRFDKQERASKFEFTPEFFGVKGIHPREFADAIFEHYSVGPIKDADDVCFSQSTCFQGRGKADEFFLVFTITGETQFHVFAPKKAD
ncbi:MAG TPA: hypothetical protein VJS40_05760 [Aestuariivirgaceae bacterium]|nr:hypothetical protein [Aestuariivirgaceae bacterium]